jgi:hypothetical protein
MDNSLEQALDVANYRLTLANQKTNLKHKLQIQQTVSHAGGLFLASIQLITYAKFLIDSAYEQQVFIDTNDIPVMVRDLPVFLNKLNEAYTAAMNEYYAETEKTKKQRTVRALVNG